MVRDEKELLFSLNADDFVWKYSRSSGAGGQNVNKRSTKVEVYHPPSGARAVSQSQRSQLQNRREALKRLTETELFQAWVAAKASGLKTPLEIEQEVNDSLANPKNLKIEIRDGKTWREVQEEDLT